jgi:flagellar M-ring protein FliF
MVAGSVAGLEPARVSLVDQAGNFLSARVDPSERYATADAADAARRYERDAVRNVRNLLAPVLGEQNFKVSVTAEVDNDRIRETHEQYGDAPRVLSEALREEVDSDPLALGVPGSLSNRPIPTGRAEGEAEPKGAPESAAQRNASTRQYAYDRSVRQVERSRGRLERLSVAVVLSSAAAPGGAGRWSPEQLAEIGALLRGGLGIDSKRGDTLVVSALEFPAHTPVAQPWWREHGHLVDYGEMLLKALIVLLVFLVIVRPLLKIATQRLAPKPIEALPVQQAIATPVEPHAALAQASARALAAGPLLHEYDLPPSGSPVDVMVDHLKALAAKEPERVAAVVKGWVQKNVRAE